MIGFVKSPSSCLLQPYVFDRACKWGSGGNGSSKIIGQNFEIVALGFQPIRPTNQWTVSRDHLSHWQLCHLLHDSEEAQEATVDHRNVVHKQKVASEKGTTFPVENCHVTIAVGPLPG